MDVEEIRALVAAGESLTVEFKRRSSPGDLNDNQLVETVTCMANSRGGTLLIGVEDRGEITGCAPWHGNGTDPPRLEALIQNRTRPPLPTAVEVVTVDGLDVVVVRIPEAQLPVGTNRGMYQRRALRTDGLPECVAYEPHSLMMSSFSASGRDWAQLPALGATFGDLDSREFERFRDMCAAAGGDRSLAELADEEILRALGLLDQPGYETPTLGAVLLFGRESSIARWVPNHEVRFQVLERTKLLTNDILRTPLFKAAEQIQDRLEARNVEEEMQWGMLRMSLPRIPARVAREAVANALVHRDYTALGATAVIIADDLFAVRSPGGLPRGVSLENLIEASRPRSRTLADAFKRVGIVERSGRGVAIMYREMLRLGRFEPDYSRTTDEEVVVSLPLGSADQELVAFVAKVQEATGELTLPELRVLHLLRSDGALGLAELAEDLDMAKAQLRPILQGMDERGLTDVRGTGRAREYHLPSSFYEVAGKKAEYVRSAPVQEARREEMALRYAQEYGAITRSQTAALCGIPSQQASLLLRGLVSDGKLEMRGSKRGAHYVPVENGPE